MFVPSALLSMWFKNTAFKPIVSLQDRLCKKHDLQIDISLAALISNAARSNTGLGIPRTLLDRAPKIPKTLELKERSAMQLVYDRHTLVLLSAMIILCSAVSALGQETQATVDTPACGRTESATEKTATCLPTELVRENELKGPEATCSNQLTVVERYVQREIENGRAVKLDPLPDELSGNGIKEPVIRGCFLRRLLTQDHKVPKSGVEIHGATITGVLDLINEDIKYDVEFTCCKFRGLVDLKRSHFAKRLSFLNSTFFDRFDAEAAVIENDFLMSGSYFKDCATFLKSMHVHGDLSLGDWYGGGAGDGADFSNMEIQGDVNGQNSEFHQREGSLADVVASKTAADFDGVKVAGATRLVGAKFYGYAGFGDGNFTRLFLTGAEFYGNSSFTRTKAEGIFLENANFLAAWPRPQTLKIDDMRFEEMNPASWDKLTTFAAATDYKPDFYSNLEALFVRHGYPDQARDVFLAGKKRDLDQLAKELKAPDKNIGDKIKLAIEWTVNSFLYWSLGYGRHLERALYAGLVILFLGWWFAFRKEEWMITRDPKDAERYHGKYRGFWYSLDLLLPVVDFGDEEIWIPNEDRRKSAFYRRIHMILGHILVPLGLAALTFKEIVK